MRNWSKRAFLSIALSLLLLATFAMPSQASYQALRLDGNGYASILDANQKGLNMGLSDFMICARIKVSPAQFGSAGYIAGKRIGAIDGYSMYINTSGNFGAAIADTDVILSTDDGGNVCDGQWHTVTAVFDRSGNMMRFLDGSIYGTADDITAQAGSIDNAAEFRVGRTSSGAPYFLIGQLDELRIFNFGYGGLPADYEAYVTWLSQDRNWFKDISEYNSGSWNCYADADRSEKAVDPGIESWTDDTPDDWTEYGESAGVRDILKETTQIHGGSAAVKLEATNNDGTAFYISQNWSPVANKFYRIGCWYHFSSRTAGRARIFLNNATDGYNHILDISSTTGQYTYIEKVFKRTVTIDTFYLTLWDETTSGIVYFDDISVKRTGLVGHWKFNGGYLDETSNSNTLVEGGTGNAFPGYTLKKQKIISPYSLN